MFPVHSAPRSLSRQISPSSWLDWRDISSAGAGSVPTAPREGFAGTRLATRLMGNSSVLFHHAFASHSFRPLKCRRVEEARTDSLQSAASKLGEHYASHAVLHPLAKWRSGPARALTIIKFARRAVHSNAAVQSKSIVLFFANMIMDAASLQVQRSRASALIPQVGSEEKGHADRTCKDRRLSAG